MAINSFHTHAKVNFTCRQVVIHRPLALGKQLAQAGALRFRSSLLASCRAQCLPEAKKRLTARTVTVAVAVRSEALLLPKDARHRHSLSESSVLRILRLLLCTLAKSVSTTSRKEKLCQNRTLSTILPLKPRCAARCKSTPPT